MKNFVVEAEKNLKELFAQKANNGSKGNPPNPNKYQGNHDIGKVTQGVTVCKIKVDHSSGTTVSSL